MNPKNRDKPISRIKRILKKYPIKNIQKGVKSNTPLPKEYNEGIINIIISKIPEIEKKLRIFNNILLKERINGNSYIFDNNKNRVKLHSKHGFIEIGYIIDMIKMDNKIIGVIEQSILNDSEFLRKEKQEYDVGK